jgi:hypothetical protein
MGRDYVSELRPPLGLFLIHHVIYMRMKKHDGIISTGENSRFVLQNFLPVLTIESSSSKGLETGEGNEVSLRSIFVHTIFFLHAVESNDMGPTALLPL